MDAADQAAAELLGDEGDGRGGELADVVGRAEKIARREQRRERGERGGTGLGGGGEDDPGPDESSEDDDQGDDGEQLAYARPAPGYTASDPGWRRGFGTVQGAPESCERCADSGIYGRPAWARIRYGDVRDWSVCAACWQRLTLLNPGISVEILWYFDSAGRRPALAEANGSYSR